MIQYKGYTGVFEYDPEIHSFSGQVIDLRDVITFYGRSVEELKQEMARSVDVYLEECEARGEDPDRPYSGRFGVRVDSTIHRAMAAAAAAEGKSMNDWVVEKLSEALGNRSG